MATIRLALCITELDLGGAERCLTELALRVDRRRFSPVVYCLGPRPAREAASCVPALEAAGVEVHCLGGKSIFYLPLVARRLRKLLSTQHPQILQTFLFHANLLGRFVARRLGIQAVVSGIRVAERHSRWHLRLDRLTQDWVDRYICVSRAVGEFSATEGGLPASKLAVIPNGIDVAAYSGRKPADLTSLDIRPGRRLITFVGRLTPQKGLPWLIETAKAWLAMLPDCDLLLVGEGPLERSLKETCQAVGLAGRVHFAGWRTDVPEILAASQLFVLPSLWEGMPNVVLEAMASSRPVVATDVEGVCELLGPNASQQTVRYGDTQSLISSVVALMRDQELAAKLGEENRHWAEKNFDISHVVSAYETLWASLVTR